MLHRDAEPHPLAQVAIGVVIALIVFGIPLACSGSTLNARLRCHLDALEILPSDPLMATVYDAVDVIERVKACDAALGPVTTDGGTP
jgi:hypothetical protein